MNVKRYAGYAALAAIATGAIVTVFLFSAGRNDAPDRAARNIAISKPEPRPANTSLVHLYFGDRDNPYLISEERIVRHSDDPTDFSRSIVKALISGPTQGLVRTLPQDTTLRAVYLTEQGICYVDLSAAVQENHPGGVDTERLTIYSIVNSLILNIAEIRAVKILIEGQETMTLAGHIDLQNPAKANMLLIR